jgi:hypothetical protein
LGFSYSIRFKSYGDDFQPWGSPFNGDAAGFIMEDDFVGPFAASKAYWLAAGQASDRVESRDQMLVDFDIIGLKGCRGWQA